MEDIRATDKADACHWAIAFVFHVYCVLRSGVLVTEHAFFVGSDIRTTTPFPTDVEGAQVFENYS
jgi:hypothetical protein